MSHTLDLATLADSKSSLRTLAASLLTQADLLQLLEGFLTRTPDAYRPQDLAALERVIDTLADQGVVVGQAIATLMAHSRTDAHGRTPTQILENFREFAASRKARDEATRDEVPGIDTLNGRTPQ